MSCSMKNVEHDLQAVIQNDKCLNVNGAKNCTLQLTKKYMFNFERILFKKRRVQFFAPLTFFRWENKRRVGKA